MVERLTPVVKILLLLNIGVFVIANLFGFEQIYNLLSLKSFESSYFEPYQIVTSMFMHADFMHLFGNMFGIFMFGSILETYFGPKNFLILYLVCGLGGGLFYNGIKSYENHKLRHQIEAYDQNPNPESFEKIIKNEFSKIYKANISYINQYYKNPKNPGIIQETQNFLNGTYLGKINSSVVGASGALFGILFAFAFYFPNERLMLLFLPVPIKAVYFVTLYGLYELFAGYNRFNDGIAHFGHLGGMLFSFLLILYWKYNRNSFN